MIKMCKIYRMICVEVLAFIFLVICVPYVLGFRPYAIMTGSMEPRISPGDMVYIKAVDIDDLELTDIVTFHQDNEIVTHRVIGIDKARYMISTKGDANKYNDDRKISITQVIGRVEFVFPFIGYGLMYLQSDSGIISGTIFLIFFVLSIVIPQLLEKKKTRV